MSDPSSVGVPMEVTLSVVWTTGLTTVVLATALAFVLWKAGGRNQQRSKHDPSSPNADGGQNGVNGDVDKSKYPGGHLSIFFASQTGTSESFANQLQREGSDHGFLVHVVDLEDVQPEELVDVARRDPETNRSKAVLLCSTYGEGEPTDNSAPFVRDIKIRLNIDNETQFAEEAHRRAVMSEQTQQGEGAAAAAGPGAGAGDNHDEEKKEEDSPTTTTEVHDGNDDASSAEQIMEGLDYCVFGLGNRQYEHYNAMGKFFDGALLRLGAKRIVAAGYGDDDNDLEGDFEQWKDASLWTHLKSLYIPQGEAGGAAKSTPKDQEESLPDCPLAVEYVASSSSSSATSNENEDGPCSIIPLEKVHASSRHYFTSVDCPVTSVRELRTTTTKEGATGSTVHVEIDISRARNVQGSPSSSPGSEFSFRTADNLGVLPLNDPSVVERVAASLHYNLDDVFAVKAAEGHEFHGVPFPMPITIRECLTRYCDLTGPPRRSDLKLLASYAKDTTDKKALLRMSSKDGKAEYKEKVLERRVGLCDILELCPSVQAPLEHFLSFCPHMVPRYYTISSSSSVHSSTVHLTVAVTEMSKPDGTMFKGLCSGYLASHPDTVRVFCRPSSFRLPENPSIPILMIGPGTGIAPMRALLQERQYQRDTLKKTNVGPNILYFGCQHRERDYIYQDELQNFQNNGILTSLHLAFSRETSQKVYVQHKLAENASRTFHLLHEKGAYVYVCGGVKMGHDVHEEFERICQTEGKLTHDESKAYLDRLSHQGRYVQELWA